MSNDRSANSVEALCSTAAAIGEDGALLALEAELDELVFKLIAAQEADQLPAVPDSSRCGAENVSVKEAQANRLEAILARLPHRTCDHGGSRVHHRRSGRKGPACGVCDVSTLGTATGKDRLGGTGSPVADRGSLRRRPNAMSFLRRGR